MTRHRKETIDTILYLRKQGKTYGEISKIIGKPIAKSTLSYWCREINISPVYHTKIQKIMAEAGERGRQNALSTNRTIRNEYLELIRDRVLHLSNSIKNADTAKIALAMLYLCEGKKSSLTFGNSNPGIISIYLSLLRACYKIDEDKFRCTVQCRADQNVMELEKFWLNLTKIPQKQFYKAQIDSRTIGKPSKKPEYKGVCRIDYFSGDVYNELKIISKVLINGLAMGR